MEAGHHHCHQQRGWDIDTFRNFINPGQKGWGRVGNISLSKCCSELPALPSYGRQEAQEPSLSSVLRAPDQPVHLLAGHSSLQPRDFFFFLLGMTEGASQCLWDKCLRVATSEGKEISLLAPRHLRRGCGALVQDIYFLNSSTESRLLGEVSITKDTQMTDDTTVLAENEE